MNVYNQKWTVDQFSLPLLSEASNISNIPLTIQLKIIKIVLFTNSLLR